mmetsp:Transcript_12849/g.24039  ORF Transcript_12849/g.24039 Transcript_12849/m.24039 type:complete len:84 (-) Transcript_12849:45-296(-)
METMPTATNQTAYSTVQLFREFSLLNIFRDSGPPERLEYPQFSPLTVVVQGRSMGLRNPLESLVECGSFTLSRVPREREVNGE